MPSKFPAFATVQLHCMSTIVEDKEIPSLTLTKCIANIICSIQRRMTVQENLIKFLAQVRNWMNVHQATLPITFCSFTCERN